MVNGQGQDVRFKINFDTTNRRITLSDQDGKIFSTSSSEYFKFKLHSQNGEVKHEVTLNGRDRSDSKKLDSIKNITYEIGDYISIWHAESETKLNIAGTVSNEVTQDITEPPTAEDNQQPDVGETPEGGTSRDSKLDASTRELEYSSNNDGPTSPTQPNSDGNYDFSNGVDKKLLERRFRLTDNGLVLVTNNAPHIWGVSNGILEIKRGDKVNLLENISASDDLDGYLTEKIKVTELDTTIVGEHQIEYKVVDSWGVETKVNRTVRINPNNNIDDLKFNVKKEDGSSFFTLEFDEIKKELKLTNKAESGTLDGNSKNDVFIFKVFNRFGQLKKTFKLKGNTAIDSNVVNSIEGFKYVDGDYISVWSKDYDNLIDIEGNIQNSPNQDVDGISKKELLDNSRFELKDGNITLIYNQAPVITGVDNKTIKRGETFDPLSGVNVTDDKETTVSTDRIIVTYDKGITAENISEVEGSYNVIYRIKDNWGRESVYNRTITVSPKNKLEESFIILKSNNVSKTDDNVILKIGFDSINKKLRVIYYNKDLYVSGNSEDTAFKISFYGDDKSVKPSFELKYETQLTYEDITKINDISYRDNDLIAIQAYNAEDGVSIKGEILNPNGTYENGFTSGNLESLDVMNNTKFKINDGGLDDIYNQAPVINGLDDLYVIKGRDFDLSAGVSVNDEDEGLSFTVEDEVDTNTIGTYTVTYTATDRWNRRTSQTRTVYVVAEYYDTKIELKNDSGERLFSIGINRFGNGFTVSDVKSDTITTQSDDSSMENPQQDNPDAIFRLKVFDTNNTEVHKVELLNSTSEELSKLDLLNSIILKQGYTFSIWSDDHTKLMVKGKIEKDTLTNNNQGFVDENYEDGIGNSDFMDNVRFTVSREKLKALYNEAPTLSIKQKDDITEGVNKKKSKRSAENTNHTLDKYSMYRGETPKHLDDIVISDDRDDLGTNSVKVTIEEVDATKENLEKLHPNASNEDETIPNNSSEGSVTKNANSEAPDPNRLLYYNGKLKYTVIDSWGRTSEIYTRPITIKPGMDRVKLVLHGRTKKNDAPIIDGDEKFFEAVRLKFNSRTMKFEFENRNNFDTMSWHGRGFKMYSIRVLNKNGEQKLEAVFEAQDRVSDSKYNVLSETQIEYGDIIKLTTNQGNQFKIHGEMYGTGNDYTEGIKSGFLLENSTFEVTENGLKEVINDPTEQFKIHGEMYGTGNDYTEGIKSGFLLENSTFEVTENGLKEVINDPTEVEENTNVLSLMTAYTGNIFVNMTIDPKTGRTIAVRGSINDTLNYKQRDRNIRFEFYKSNGTLAHTQFELNGAHNSGEENGKYVNLFNNIEFEVGDYFTIKPYRKEDTVNYRILGNVEKPDNVEDFSDGIQEPDELENIRFTLTEKGLKAVYKARPTINVPGEVKVEGQSHHSEVYLPERYGVYNILDGVTATNSTNEVFEPTINVPGEVKVEGQSHHSEVYLPERYGVYNILDGVTATNSTNEVFDVTVNGENGSEIDLSNATNGYYTRTYSVTDSWGRVTTKTVIFRVKPRLLFNKIKVYRDSDKSNSAFEIGINTDSSKYTFKSNTDEVMDSLTNSNSIFKIWIVGSDNSVKFKADILGLDQANSNKFDELKDLNYQIGDKIMIS